MGDTITMNGGRLLARLDELARIGRIDADGGHGACRIALTDDDRRGRDLVVAWMRALALDVTVDRIGNVVATRAGIEEGAPVMIGSHIDTVASGGRYDGNLGVLAGLELIETLNERSIETRRPIAVAFFTNEEGVRFTPDMMGSGVHQGALALDDMLAAQDADGVTLGDALERIGYAGDEPLGALHPHSYVELHIEQGPVLEEAGVTIGAVEGVQGISWTEHVVTGVSNHAGTTPMRLRHDAGFAASAIAVEARRLAQRIGGAQVATVGAIELFPNLINVIANRARVTVDLRNTDAQLLREAELELAATVQEIADAEGVRIASKSLVRLDPVAFDDGMIALVETKARARDHSVLRMPSGAGHDAQMFAPNCPTAMVFVPSQNGVSHNVRELTSPEHIQAGADVLLDVVLARAERVRPS